MMEAVEKGLDPTEDWQFNQKHPRGFGGKFGPKPMQIQQQEEAQVPDTSGDPADSEVVDTGTNEQDAEVAVSKESAKRLKKSAEAVPHSQLVVVFESRADATKFAIAAEHATESSTPFKVTAAANGKYHVEPEGLTAEQIDHLQEQIHAKLALGDITVDQEPVGKDGKVTKSLTDAERDLLYKALGEGNVTTETLPQILVMAEVAAELNGGDGFLAKLEGAFYGSYLGLAKAGRSHDPLLAARAHEIYKGVKMRNPLLVPIKVPTGDGTHDSMENDGKAKPLGTEERVTDPVGAQEKITEATAKYPRTGHKQARRPRLILNR